MNSFCEECGSKLHPGDKFCQECGTPAVNQSIPEQEIDKLTVNHSFGFFQSKRDNFVADRSISLE
ncbi:MAG: zinc-ribbon domain-containing protein [Bacteroidales bacterium]